MIIPLNLPTKYYIVYAKKYMRKDIDALSSSVQTEFDMNLFNQSLFFFEEIAKIDLNYCFG